MDIQVPEIPTDVLLQRANIKHFDIQAKVIRANGNVEDYGTIAGWDRNIFKHILLQMKIYWTRLKINWNNK